MKRLLISIIYIIYVFSTCSKVLGQGNSATLSASAVTGSITTCQGTPSASPSIEEFSVIGNYLSSGPVVTAPSGFEVSLSLASSYSNSVVLPALATSTGGQVHNEVIYVRASATAPAGNILGNIIITANGATSLSIGVNATVNPPATVNNIPNQTVVNGGTTTAVNPTGTGSTFTWTNDTPGIGLSASGSGNIPSFTAVNTTGNPITAQITVTPSFSLSGCSSMPTTFTITVNPVVSKTITATTPTGIITACQGSPSASPSIQQFTVSWSGINTGLTITAPPNFEISLSPNTGYENSFEQATISLSSQGVGNSTVVYVRSSASAPTGFISGNVSITATGVTQNVAVSGVINPVPTVTSIQNQTVTAGNITLGAYFTGTATSYNWINDTPSIGLLASGTGNIDPFIATNNTGMPVTATVTVSPQPQPIYAYVPNAGSLNVSVINLETNSVVATIPIYNTPTAIALSPDGKRAYVAVKEGGLIIINTTSNTVITLLALQPGDNGVAVSPDGSIVYVTNTIQKTITLIGTSATKFNGVIQYSNTSFNPYYIAVSPNGQHLYFTDNVANDVIVVSTATQTVESILTGFSAPSGIWADPDGSKFYVANSGNNTVTVFATANNTILATVNVGISPQGVISNPDGSFVYVTNNGDNSLSVINISTNKVVSTIAVGSKPTGVSLSPDGSEVCVENSGSNNVSVINALTNKVTTTIAVGTSPQALGNFITPVVNCSGLPTTFTITVNPVTNAVINALGTISLSTIYGTPSQSNTFSVSGSNLSASILVTPPTGFEVSVDGINYTKTATVVVIGATLSPTPVYIRLAATMPVGNYSGNIILSTANAASFSIPVVSTVRPAPLIIAANNLTKIVEAENPTLTVKYSGFVNDENGKVLSPEPIINTTATTASPVGEYPITVSGAGDTNYDITYVNGTLTIVASNALVIPNTFTPNGDGINDTWQIQHIENYPNCTVYVYNRYGEKVLSSTGYGVAWDGTYKGVPLPSGTYYYLIDTKTSTKMLSGWVAIIR